MYLQIYFMLCEKINQTPWGAYNQLHTLLNSKNLLWHRIAPNDQGCFER